MKVRIDIVKRELTEDVGTRTDVALQLASSAVRFKFRKDEESNRGETIVVWIDVYNPTVPALLMKLVLTIIIIMMKEPPT